MAFSAPVPQWVAVVNPTNRSWLPAEAEFALATADGLHILTSAQTGEPLRAD